MYKWDEMNKKERDWLVASKVMCITEKVFNFNWPAQLNFSNDIGSAWTAIDELQNRGIYIDVEAFADFYRVTAHQEHGHQITGSTHKKVIDAICITLLRAVGIEVE